MLAAGGSVGKTMALTQLAVAVATGRRWLECRNGTHEDFPGFDTPEEGGRVLLALGEEDAGEARRRLHAAVMGTGLTREEKALVASRIVVAPLMGQGVQLIAPADKWGTQPPQPTAFALELRARLMESPEPWSLVVIDPLSRWAGPDTETDNAAATKFVQLLETFTKAPGTPTVLVAHHTTKGARREGTADDTAARGASALSDGVRWHAHMTAKPHPEGVHGVGVPRMAELRVVKTNYGLPLDETLWLARDEGGLLRAASRREKAEFVEADKAAKGEDKPAKGAPNSVMRAMR
jgi:RecA-family ATPase